MVSQHELAREALVAVGALERPLSRVRPPMVHQRSLGGERHGAHVALERLVARVRAHVAAQVEEGAARCRTDGARVPLAVCVAPHVARQVELCAADDRTQLARPSPLQGSQWMLGWRRRWRYVRKAHRAPTQSQFFDDIVLVWHVATFRGGVGRQVHGKFVAAAVSSVRLGQIFGKCTCQRSPACLLLQCCST